MNRERWVRIDDVFSAALERPESEWSDFVAEACGTDTALRREVDALLQAHRATGLFDHVVRDGRGPVDPSSDVRDPRVGERIGPYVVESVLGRGGMGTVYSARRGDGHFDQEVALKVLPRGLASPDLTARFLAERQILARLTHANIAGLLDGGVSDSGYPWFAMERVEGVPLLEYADGARLAVGERLEVWLTICEAVEFAHSKLVVHRDLKPNNILVTADGTPKLLDFGIAKVLDPTALGLDDVETRVGLRVLTPAYASPEQLRGEAVGTVSDVYQLGLLLYELLTGVHPWRIPGSRRGASTSTESTHPVRRPSVALRDVTDESAPTAVVRVDPKKLRGDLDAIVLKALREEPELRYRSVDQLAEDVKRHLDGRPVRAHADTLVYRATKFARRNTAPLAASVAVVLGLVAFGAGMARETRRTAVQRDRAEEVTRFMVDLFRNADPYIGGGGELTVRSLLDQGSGRVRNEFDGPPLVKAAMLDAIGDAYWELGFEEEGLASRGEALEEWVTAPGASDADRAAALAKVGRMRASTGDGAGGRPLLIEAEEVLAGTRSGATYLRANTLNDIGLGWQALTELDRAEPALEEAARLFLSLAAGDAGAASIANLAWLRQARADPDSAEVLFNEALEMRVRASGDRHPSVATTLQGIGEFYLGASRPASADSAFRQALLILDGVLEPDHPSVGRATAGLARAQAALGEHEEADRLFVESLGALEGRLGFDHLTVGTTRNSYAIFLQRMGRLREASESFAIAEDTYRKRLGPDHVNTATVAGNAAWVLFLTGDTEGAVTRYRRATRVLLEEAPERIGTYGTLVDFGIVLCRTSEPTAAKEPLSRARDELEIRAPAGNAHLRALNALGSCLGQLERFAESESVLLETLGLTSERPGDDPYVAFATSALATTYEAWGRPDDAEAVRAGRLPQRIR